MENNSLFKILGEYDLQKENLHNQIESYKEHIKSIEEKIKELEPEIIKHGQSVVKYSNFFKFSVGPALAELLSTISGREYIYSSVSVRNIIQGEIIYKHTSIVVEKTNYKKCYSDYNLNGLIREGNVISFYEEETPISQIPTFFRINGGNVSINPEAINFNQEELPYVVDFLKSLVQYCYDRNIYFVSSKNINKCMKNFLDEYKVECTNHNQILTKN